MLFRSRHAPPAQRPGPEARQQVSPPLEQPGRGTRSAAEGWVRQKKCLSPGRGDTNESNPRQFPIQLKLLLLQPQQSRHVVATFRFNDPALDLALSLT